MRKTGEDQTQKLYAEKKLKNGKPALEHPVDSVEVFAHLKDGNVAMYGQDGQ